MSDSVQGKPVAVFIDVEGFCSTPTHEHINRSVQSTKRFLGTLRREIEGRGFCITGIHGFASKKPGRRILSKRRQRKMRNVFSCQGASMHWCDGIADDAMEHFVRSRMRRRELPSHVILVADDGDFGRVVEDLVHYGYKVAICGNHNNISDKLKQKGVYVAHFNFAKQRVIKCHCV